jgi:hypothetical protein
MFKQVNAANPMRPYGETLSPTIMNALDRARFFYIYSALSTELRLAGKQAEADECDRRLNAMIEAVKAATK